MIGRALLLAAALATAPAWADAPSQISATAVAPLLADTDRIAARQLFMAIRARDWPAARAALEQLPAGPLANVARAELYLAKGAPTTDAASLIALARIAPDLPQAPALVRAAAALGGGEAPLLPMAHELVRSEGPSKRLLARPTRGDAQAARLAQQLAPLFKANDGAAAEPLVEAAAGRIASDALTELRQRTAWAYFLAGDDAGAQRVATLARGGTGEWAVQAHWVAGLAAWRAGNHDQAAEAFEAVATRATDSETIAAGFFWAARSDGAAGRTDRAAARLRSAARLPETFYGLIAEATLGDLPLALAESPAPASPDRPNLVAAAALARVGEAALADELLRHQARIGPAGEHAALIALAGELGLPETQLWLSRNVPAGATPSLFARYPMPAWRPTGGWRVDRALLYAHALQESRFRPDAVSPAGARGLMQLMPGTAQLVARHKGEMPGPLNDPAVSFEYGQSYLERLATHPGTGGLLPKVIAAYNAGPNNVAAWNARASAPSDPLLFIESIPFSETRNYVAIVLRNYWMYQRATGASPVSLTELAQGRWPVFPSSAPLLTAQRDEIGGAMLLSR